MILWKGQEDVDFVVKASGFSAITDSSYYRNGYARCAISASAVASPHQGYPFTPVTSAWVTGYYRSHPNGLGAGAKLFGLGKSGVAQGGIFVGIANGDVTRVALFHQSATGTYTQKQAETGQSAVNGMKLDMRIENFGANTRVRVYVNGGVAPVIDYTGDLLWTGATELDCYLVGTIGATYNHGISEGIVADEDTRAMSLVTLYPNAVGDANTLDSGTQADIDEAVANDADLLSSATTGQVAQFNLSNLPVGAFTIKDVTGVFRGIRGSTGIQNWKFGLKTNGTINIGQTYLMDTGWASYQRIFGSLNPVTGNPWTQAEIDALQIAFESLT
jgi:hypothetical protein